MAFLFIQPILGVCVITYLEISVFVLSVSSITINYFDTENVSFLDWSDLNYIYFNCCELFEETFSVLYNKI